MLKKLLKYELKNTYKNLIIFYLLSIFFALLTRIFFSIENSTIFNIIGHICSGTSISMIFNILINNLMRLWVRFRQNLYGDESYLTHTLPIKKETLYLSKILTSLITLFTSTLVIGLTLFIAYYSKENLELLKDIILPIVDAYGTTVLKILLAFLFVFFIEIANGLQAGFTGTILGHRMNNLKIGYSILFGFGIYMAIQTFGLIIMFIISLFNQDLMNLFITNDVANIEVLKVILYLSTTIYLISFIAMYFINIKLFKKGVNIE